MSSSDLVQDSSGIPLGQNCIPLLTKAPEKQGGHKRSSKDEEIQRGSVPCAEDDGVVFFSIRLAHREGIAGLMHRMSQFG